jgi:hypothetical protein
MRFWTTVVLSLAAVTWVTASQQWAKEPNRPVAYHVGSFAVPTALLLLGVLMLGSRRKSLPREEIVDLEVSEPDEIIDLEIDDRQRRA